MRRSTRAASGRQTQVVRGAELADAPIRAASCCRLLQAACSGSTAAVACASAHRTRSCAARVCWRVGKAADPWRSCARGTGAPLTHAADHARRPTAAQFVAGAQSRSCSGLTGTDERSLPPRAPAGVGTHCRRGATCSHLRGARACGSARGGATLRDSRNLRGWRSPGSRSGLNARRRRCRASRAGDSRRACAAAGACVVLSTCRR